jgi:serine/threonine protein kinase
MQQKTQHMEKYDGNLFDFLKKYKSSNKILTKNIIRLSLQNLLSSLHFIHQNCNICLNDIKLENILYKNNDGYYDFCFGDFGLSEINSSEDCKENDLRKFNESIEFLLQSI